MTCTLKFDFLGSGLPMHECVIICISPDDVMGRINMGHKYYLWDTSTGGVVCTYGYDLKSVAEQLSGGDKFSLVNYTDTYTVARAFIINGANVMLENELVLYRNGNIHAIWYNGMGCIIDGLNLVWIHGLSPLQVSDFNNSKYGVRFYSYRNFLRTLMMEVI